MSLYFREVFRVCVREKEDRRPYIEKIKSALCPNDKGIILRMQSLNFKKRASFKTELDSCPTAIHSDIRLYFFQPF